MCKLMIAQPKGDVICFEIDAITPVVGVTLIFSHKRRLGLFFGFKILNFNIFGGFQKNKYFLGV